MHKVLLGVNIDHIATLRNIRKTHYPDLIQAAIIAEKAGANSITVHLRKDRRHILDDDIESLRNRISTNLNLEIALSQEMLTLAVINKVNSCCLVPEKTSEITTEGGLDILSQTQKVKNAVSYLSDENISVSLFVDPDISQIKSAADTGVKCIEIHTGYYALNKNSRRTELLRIKNAVDYAIDLGLKVNAGHALNYNNVKEIARLQGINELNIGHAIISQAIIVGMESAVKEMKSLILMSCSEKK